MRLWVTHLLRPTPDPRNNICSQRAHLGGRVASATAESHHGRTTLTGIGTAIDATEVAVVLGAAVVVVVVSLYLPKRATVEVSLRGSEVSLRHFQLARTQIVITVLVRVALTEKFPGSERSKVSAPPTLSRYLLTSLKIAQDQMTTHLMVHLSGLRSTGIPALVWVRFMRSSDVTEDFDVIEDNPLNPCTITIRSTQFESYMFCFASS